MTFWLVVGAAGLLAFTVRSFQTGAFDPPWLVVLAGALVLGGNPLRVELPLANRTLAIDLTEVGVVLAFVLLPPPAVVLPASAGVLAATLLLRETRLQIAYNSAVVAAGASAAALVVALLNEGAAIGTAPVDVLSASGFAALVAGVLVYGAINISAAGMLLVRLDSAAYDLARRSMVLGGILGFLLTGSIGIIAAVLVSAAPLALPALVLPVWIAQRALAERVARIREDVAERDRLVRTVEGAKDGIALLDPDDRVELANPAFRARIGRGSDDLVGTPLVSLVAEWRIDRPGTGRSEGAGQVSAPPEVAAERAGGAIEALLRALTPVALDGAVNLLTGERVYTLAVTGLFDQLGSRTGTVVLLIDVTASWEADQLRRDLVARVSHELRTPLTSIEGFVETLRARDAELTAEQRSYYLEVVDRQARRLHRLVANLLWSARIERARTEPQPESLRLSAEVAEALEVLGQHFPEPATIDVGDLSVEADPDQLQQVLINLLSNAASYGRPPIVISAQPRSAVVEVVVCDGGDGVPSDFVDRLFEPLTQSSVGDRRTAAGLGLGLSIVRALVERNDGTIEYRRVDGRTEFVCTLPAAREAG